jgi:hypothetical protein
MTEKIEVTLAKVIVEAKFKYDQDTPETNEDAQQEFHTIDAVERTLDEFDYVSQWFSPLIVDMMIHRMDETVEWANHLLAYHEDAGDLGHITVFKTKYYDK